ncbi:transposase [Weissella cibaria]|uniref:transposase n=1 Tax=Weissella cibaria TaxID=137591 RepID=UPI0020933474|nr:transposase [Weissella cibaria]
MNSFFCGFSNGPIEYSNTKIKAIKHTAYGLRSSKTSVYVLSSHSSIVFTE